jgi:hypothetical protein
MMELYLHSTIPLHGIMLNYIFTGKPSSVVWWSEFLATDPEVPLPRFSKK